MLLRELLIFCLAKSEAVGSLHLDAKIRDMIGPEEISAKDKIYYNAQQTLAEIRDYQREPNNDLSNFHGPLMHNFSQDSNLTFQVRSVQSLTVNISAVKPLFRATWAVVDGGDEKGLTVRMFDPKGDLQYYAKQEIEGIIAFEATEFGPYHLEVATTVISGQKTISILTSLCSVNDLFTDDGLKNTLQHTEELAARAMDMTRTSRFFTRRRESHVRKLLQNIGMIKWGSIATLVAAVLVAVLQVASIKYLVRRSLAKMIF